jgi:hypothetical protein
MKEESVARFALGVFLVGGILLVSPGTAVAQTGAPTASMPSASTPGEMVATYSSLADGILALNRAEANLVRSILAAAYGHAQAELGRAQKALKAGDAKAARAAVEALAADVGQLGTEGDTAVAGVRKRLIEGGHHHNAAEEAKGIFEEGYVVVTRAAKKVFLDASRAIGQQAGAPNAESLEAEWKKVQTVYAELAKPGA